jgi:hypothetical protein
MSGLEAIRDPIIANEPTFAITNTHVLINYIYFLVPLHAMEALGGRGGIAPTHSRPRH